MSHESFSGPFERQDSEPLKNDNGGPQRDELYMPFIPDDLTSGKGREWAFSYGLDPDDPDDQLALEKLRYDGLPAKEPSDTEYFYETHRNPPTEEFPGGPEAKAPAYFIHVWVEKGLFDWVSEELGDPYDHFTHPKKGIIPLLKRLVASRIDTLATSSNDIMAKNLLQQLEVLEMSYKELEAYLPEYKKLMIATDPSGLRASELREFEKFRKEHKVWIDQTHEKYMSLKQRVEDQIHSLDFSNLSLEDQQFILDALVHEID